MLRDDDEVDLPFPETTNLQVGEDPRGNVQLLKVSLEASQEPLLARYFDGVAEEDLDVCMCVHPVPRERDD